MFPDLASLSFFILDFLTIIGTEKDIKTHAYERLKNDKKSND